MNKGNQKGITLIALIITIIVILILVAVTVSTAANSGLFDHAKDATNKWATEQDRESNIGDEVDALIDKHVGNYCVGVGNHTSHIILKNKKTNEPTDFQKAYVKYNGENIEITEYIDYWTYDGEYLYIHTSAICYAIAILTETDGSDGFYNKMNELRRTEQEITLVKDGISYTGKVALYWEYS